MRTPVRWMRAQLESSSSRENAYRLRQEDSESPCFTAFVRLAARRLPRKKAFVRWLFRSLCSAGLFLPITAVAQQPDLSQLGIEELMNIKVTSVDKTEHKMIDSAAAVFVITQDDIRQSGMTSIPELLRMVPGLSVAQIDGSMWAISARGFNFQFANKLLVLIDGRSVYTPLYSGVYWEVQDLLLEDIDRIEVIRGPGAALWGANAVNGVINIITKRAQDTQGGLLTSGISSAEQRFGGLRYGGKLGASGFWRAYAKYQKRDGLNFADGAPSPDGWDAWRGGFRGDFQITPADSLTWQGDTYLLSARQQLNLTVLDPLFESVTDAFSSSGGNLLARWTHTGSPRSDFSLQAYFDAARRNELMTAQRLNTFDLQFQHHRLVGERQELLWGLGFRRISDRLRSSAWVQVLPGQEGTNLFSGFVQDEVSLLQGRMRLTLGSKVEHNDYTGVNLQPSARIAFALCPRHHLWAAVSRAVRTPSRSERDMRANVSAQLLPDGTVLLAAVLGNRNLRPEKLLAYEAGYRGQLGSRLTLDLASYYNDYTDIFSVAMDAPIFELTPAPPHVLFPMHFINQTRAHGYGAELAASLKLSRSWKLSAAETWGKVIFQYPIQQGNPYETQLKGGSPVEQFTVRSSYLLARNLQVEAAAFFVGSLDQQGIPAYTRLDLGLAWLPSARLEFRLGAQNLLQDQHPEYNSIYAIIPTEVRRNIFARATWRF